MTEAAGEVMHTTNVIASAVAAGVSIYEAYKNPTTANITKAVLETGWAALQAVVRVNPWVAGGVAAVEVANAIFKWW